MKNKVAMFGIVVQLAGLIYGILNNAVDIIVMCLIFMFISTIALFDKKKKWKNYLSCLHPLIKKKN